MGSGPVKGFNSEHVQQIITKKHDAVQNKIAKEDSETATFAAGKSMTGRYTAPLSNIYIQDVSGESSLHFKECQAW